MTGTAGAAVAAKGSPDRFENAACGGPATNAVAAGAAAKGSPGATAKGSPEATAKGSPETKFNGDKVDAVGAGAGS